MLWVGCSPVHGTWSSLSSLANNNPLTLPFITAAAYANFLIYPLDVVSTRMQVQSRSSSSSTQKNPEIPEERPSHTVYAGTLDGLRKIMEQEGLKGLYAGLATGLGGSM